MNTYSYLIALFSILLTACDPEGSSKNANEGLSANNPDSQKPGPSPTPTPIPLPEAVKNLDSPQALQSFAQAHQSNATIQASITRFNKEWEKLKDNTKTVLNDLDQVINDFKNASDDTTQNKVLRAIIEKYHLESLNLEKDFTITLDAQTKKTLDNAEYSARNTFLGFGNEVPGTYQLVKEFNEYGCNFFDDINTCDKELKEFLSDSAFKELKQDLPGIKQKVTTKILDAVKSTIQKAQTSKAPPPTPQQAQAMKEILDNYPTDLKTLETMTANLNISNLMSAEETISVNELLIKESAYTFRYSVMAHSNPALIDKYISKKQLSKMQEALKKTFVSIVPEAQTMKDTIETTIKNLHLYKDVKKLDSLLTEDTHISGNESGSLESINNALDKKTISILNGSAKDDDSKLNVIDSFIKAKKDITPDR